MARLVAQDVIVTLRDCSVTEEYIFHFLRRVEPRSAGSPESCRGVGDVRRLERPTSTRALRELEQGECKEPRLRAGRATGTGRARLSRVTVKGLLTATQVADSDLVGHGVACVAALHPVSAVLVLSADQVKLSQRLVAFVHSVPATGRR